MFGKNHKELKLWCGILHPNILYESIGFRASSARGCGQIICHEHVFEIWSKQSIAFTYNIHLCVM